MRIRNSVLLVVCLVGSLTVPGLSQEPPSENQSEIASSDEAAISPDEAAISPDEAAISPDEAAISPDEAAIRQAIQSYVNAFNSRDAQSLAALWSADGVYTSRTTGDDVVGRDAMEKEFTDLFAQKGARQLSVVTDSIQFLSPNVALERGTSTVMDADENENVASYRVVYVKQDGKWLVDRVTDDETVATSTHQKELRVLDWLIGEWVDQGDDATVSFDCQWTKNKNYISRTYSISEGDKVTSSGLQIIGWDSKHKGIRSWLFDSSGGFVQGKWTQNEGRWIVQSVAVLADGTSGSFTSVFRPLDENSYGWQKVNRIAAGELMPNIGEIVVTRK